MGPFFVGGMDKNRIKIKVPDSITVNQVLLFNYLF